MDGSRTTSLAHWLPLLSLWYTVGILVQRNMEITALRNWLSGGCKGQPCKSVHVQASPGSSCLHSAVMESRIGASRRRIFPKIAQKLMQSRQQAGLMTTHTLSSNVPQVFSAISPVKFFSKATWDDPSTEMTWLLFLARLFHPIPRLDTSHGTANSYGELPQPKTNHLK